MTSAAIALASSPAAAPPMPSATMKSDPRWPHFVVADVGLQAGVAGAEVGDEEGVLVVIPGESQVGLAEDGHADRGAGHSGEALQSST